MWRMSFWFMLFVGCFILFVGCTESRPEYTLHGRVRKITQRIDKESCAIFIVFQENETEINLTSDAPISGDYKDQEVVLTYIRGSWNNQFVKLERTEEYAERKYDQLTESK